MKPLVYLFTRSFVNGVKRSFSSPRRLIGLLFFFSYYYWIFMRPGMSGRGAMGRMPTSVPQFDVPPMQVIDAVVFSGFVALSILLSMSIFSYRGGFKPADVDVLFPTPISPKILLLFRLVRDYLLTLIVPLIFAVFVYRPASAGFESLLKGLKNPSALNDVPRMAWVSYLLISMAFVAVGYACSIYFNRPEPIFERMKRIIGWVLFAGIIAVATFIILRIRASQDSADLVRLTQSPILRSVFFMATGATELTTAPLKGAPMNAVLGGGMLLLFVAAGVALALKQAGYIYEEAALRAGDINNAREMQRKGDTFGILANQARSGRIKAGRRSWIHKLRLKGASALVWKEYLLQARSVRVLFILFPVFAIFLSVAPALITSGMPTRSGREAPIGPMLLLVQLMMVFVSTASTAQGGYLEMLRRVDLQKPLPFRPAAIIFYEVLSKASLGIVTCLAGAISALIVAPYSWPQALAVIIGMPAVAILLSAVFCLVIVLFPDVEDPTQRGFRGLVNMLGILVFCGPSILVYGLLIYLKLPPAVAAIPVAAMNIGLAILAATIAGNLYASFNPSE